MTSRNNSGKHDLEFEVKYYIKAFAKAVGMDVCSSGHRDIYQQLPSAAHIQSFKIGELDQGAFGVFIDPVALYGG